MKSRKLQVQARFVELSREESIISQMLSTFTITDPWLYVLGLPFLNHMPAAICLSFAGQVPQGM